MAGSERAGAGRLAILACLIAALYLPTLSTRFDFIDDGNLVYPAPAMPVRDRVALYWEKVVANYQGLGPFRPVLWAHWEAQADAFGANARVWRAWRLAWTALSAFTMLLLLRELEITPVAAVFGTAVAMAAPARSEIWMSLTLAEGVAMPYAILALVFAARAAKNTRPWKWDVASILCVLAALGCKNTFAAIIPAQILLRLSGEHDFGEGFKKHWLAAVAMASVLVLPLLHLVIFESQWHRGQYQPGVPSTRQLQAMLSLIGEASAAPFLAAGVIVSIVAIIADPGQSETKVWQRYKMAWLTGLALVVAGIGIYLPMQNTAGRYSIPAVWGMDIWLAALVSALADRARRSIRTLAAAGLVAGLIGIVVANVDRQIKLQARSSMLWNALEYVEQENPGGTCIGWRAGQGLELSEGIHFYWHLLGRNGKGWSIDLLGEHGAPVKRAEIAQPCNSPSVMITDRSFTAVREGNWEEPRDFETSYRFGAKKFRCRIWRHG